MIHTRYVATLLCMSVLAFNLDSAAGLDCQGRTLQSRQKLYPGEAICQGNAKFGLTLGGDMVYKEGTQTVWSKNTNGSYLHIQADGNLVVYKEQSNGNLQVKWAKNCKAGGAYVKIFDNNGVKVLKSNGDVLWMIDSDGNESGCNNRRTLRGFLEHE